MNERNLLMVLGPVEIEPDILEAGSWPQVYNRTAEFSERLSKIYQDLQYVFQTENPVLFSTSSGTGMMEAAITNTLSRSDKVLFVNGGTFGERWGKICLKHGIDAKEIRVSLGESVNPSGIDIELRKNPAIKAVLITQDETSTGTLTDVEAVARIVRGFPNTILVVDCISSLVVEKMKMDSWGVDVAVSGSQKSLAIPPGLGFISFSQKALRLGKEAGLRSFYFDIFDHIENWRRNQTPFTPSISLLFQLEARLEKIRNEGLENIQKRYQVHTSFLRNGLREFGLNILAKNPANCVSAVMVEDCDASDIVELMSQKHGISIAPSGGELRTKLFRVGNFGNIGTDEINKCLKALRLTIEELREKKERSVTRIYNDREDIDAHKVCEFWNLRASKTDSVKGVLLGEGLAKNSADLRNDKERDILKRLLPKNKNNKVLDIGSGLGRWVRNLESKIDTYTGIDFSDNYVQKATELCNAYNNVHFFQMSATALDCSRLLKGYDLVIMNGVCMYINDEDLFVLFGKLNGLIANDGCIYLQESISILGGRMTLKDFYSEDLNCKYHAIYRTRNEYEELITKFLPSFEVRTTGLLLDKETGAREETNAQYWFLSRRVHS